MSFQQRLIIFCVGIGLGALLSWYILKNRGFQEQAPIPETLAEAEMEAVPGILKHYEETPAPLESTFLYDEFREPASEAGTFRRVIILQGRQPGQLLRIVEIQTPQADGTLTVSEWHVTAANRVVVQLEPGTKPAGLREPLAGLEYRLLERGTEPDTYVVALNDSKAKSVDLAIESIEKISPEVVAVSPDYLDKAKTDD